MQNPCFVLFGSDERQSALAQILRTEGTPVYLWPQDPLPAEPASIAVLPMPLYDEEDQLRIPNLDEHALLALLKTAKLVIGGRVPQKFAALAAENKIRLIDYAIREDFAISNALTTAEAAVCIAMENRKANLAGSSALVIGYGRIGRCLSRLLAAMGVHVTVSARKAVDFAWIRTDGFACADTRTLDGLEAYEMIFNTVPALVLDRDRLTQVREDALLIDLASVPGGIDRYAATMLGRSVIWALRLPGKYAPYSAARSSADSIFAILSEEQYEG